MQRRAEVSRKPGEKEIEVVVVGSHAERQAPDLLSAQQEEQRCGVMWIDRGFVLPASGGDVIAFSRRQQRVVGRIAIDEPEQRKVDQAQHSGEDEAHAPSPVVHHDGDHGNADR